MLSFLRNLGCIFEYHNGEIELLRASEKYAQIIGSAGMTVEAALGLKWSAHLDRENSEKVIRDLEESIATRKEVKGEYVFLDLPGCPHETYLRSFLRVIASAGERYLVYCTNENVTAQRLAERQAREAAEQVQDMMDDMPGGFMRMRIGSKGGISPVYINEGFLRLIGRDRQGLMEAYARDAYDGVHPEDLAGVREAVAQVLKGGEPYSTRCRVARGKGGYVWLSVLGRVTKNAGGDSFLNMYFTDVSQQVKEEETQRALLDNLPCGAGVYEFKNGQMSLTYQNKSYWDMVGLYEEAYPDEAPMSAVHPDDIPVIMRELSLAIEQRRDVVCEIRLRHLTLGYRPVHLVGRVVFREDGSFLIYATFTPIDHDGITYQQTLPLLLSTIMEASNDFAFAKDRSFRYICCSPAFLLLAGLRDEREVAGKTDYELFPAQMAEQFRQNDLKLLESGKPMVDFEETIHAQDGSVHYCLASKHILRDATGTNIGIYGVSRDVTREHSALEQLQLVNDSIPGGIATYEVRDGEISIVYCNDGFCRLFGGTKEGLERRGEIDHLDWVMEEDRAGLLAQVEALVKEDAPLDAVFRIRVLGGGCKWISEKAITSEHRGDTVRFNAILLDITERQTINEQLRISEEENNLAVQHGGSVVCRFSVKDRSLSVSPSVAQAYSIPEVIFDVPYEPVRLGLISPESAEAYIGFFEGIVSGSRAGTVLYQQRYFGQWRWMEAKSSTIFGDDGSPVKAVISLFDVTDRLEKETIYKKWQHSLEDRAPESYTLFRCNLNRNIGYETREGTLFTFNLDNAGIDFNDRARVYAEKCVLEEDRDRYIAFVNSDTMLAAYYRGRRSDTLDYRELWPEGQPRWLRLTVDLVESPSSTDVEAYLMYEDIDRAKRAELETRTLSETDPLTGVLNRATFAARVESILSNASPDEKHALLMLDLDGFKQVNDVFGHGAGDHTLIDLASGLRGMMRRDDLVARLGGDEFMVFLGNVLDMRSVITKAKQIRALARRSFSLEVQISASVGIALSPRDGVGFETLYKRADAALYFVKGSGKDGQAVYNENMADQHLEPEPDRLEAGGTRLAEKKRRMLIVEDNEIDHALLQNVFKDEFILERGVDGSSALVRLRHYGSAISVVLLDLMMPGMNGFVVLEKIQESAELRDIPVIIVSGDESRETCMEAIRKGATDFITKPVDIELLRIRVRSAVSKAENERLRAKNSLLEVQSRDKLLYEAYLDTPGVSYVEYDRVTGGFRYYPSISGCLAGSYDDRGLWEILLADAVAEEKTVLEMQRLFRLAEETGDEEGTGGIVRLRTPGGQLHSFRMGARRLINEHRLTEGMVISLIDLEHGV